MNEQWFVADEGGKLFVCRFVQTIWGDERRLELTHYTTTQFKEKFRRFRWTSQTGMAKPTTVYLAEQWLRSPARRQYERVIFSGAGPGTGHLEPVARVCCSARTWRVHPDLGTRRRSHLQR